MGIALAGVVNGIINAHSSGNKLRGTVSVSYTHLGDRVRFAAAPCAYLRPAAVAALAARDADKAVDYLTLQPLYLRAPQAERERAAREAKQHG